MKERETRGRHDEMRERERETRGRHNKGEGNMTKERET